MHFKKILFASCCTLLLAGSLINYLYASNENTDHGIFTPSQMKWAKGPDALPTGVMVTVLEGDPSKEGPFTLRLKTPASYKIPPHWHTAIEHVTIISGEMDVGMGDKFDLKSTTHLPVGSFFYMAPEMRHFVYMKKPTILQLHGIGPWNITYVDSNDDPRNKQTKQ